MCATCDEALRLPVDQALRLVAQAMKRKRLACLDALVGKLVGVETPERNLEAEAQWERNRG